VFFLHGGGGCKPEESHERLSAGRSRTAPYRQKYSNNRKFIASTCNIVAETIKRAVCAVKGYFWLGFVSPWAHYNFILVSSLLGDKIWAYTLMGAMRKFLERHFLYGKEAGVGYCDLSIERNSKFS
jgi:hypothetical protein